MYGSGAGTGIATVRRLRGRILLVRCRVLTVSDAVVVGATMRPAASVRFGAATAPAAATAMWVCAWLAAREAYTNCVNRPCCVCGVFSCTNKECVPYASTVSFFRCFSLSKKGAMFCNSIIKQKFVCYLDKTKDL